MFMRNLLSIPSSILSYFGLTEVTNDTTPIIVSKFSPVKGWSKVSNRKRASKLRVLAMRLMGVTHVALQSGVRRADFSITELVV